MSLTILEDIPYFNNLVKNTDKFRAYTFVEWCSETDNILAKMFSKDLQFEVYNPDKLDQMKLPIIDVERLLADKKFGIIEETDLIQILDKYTLAFEVFRAYRAFKKVCKDGEIEKMVFKSRGNLLEQEVYIEGKENPYIRKLSLKNQDAVKMKAFLDKMPLKTATIKFVEKVETDDE